MTRSTSRTRGSGCGGSESRSLHRSARPRPRALQRRRRAADRQPARAHRRAPLRRPRGTARPARPALRQRRPLRRADALLAGRAARTSRARRDRGRRPCRVAVARRQRAPVCADADRALVTRDARNGVRDRGAPRLGLRGGALRADRGAARVACVRTARVARPVSGRVPVDDRRGRRIACRPSRPRRVGAGPDPPDVPPRCGRGARRRRLARSALRARGCRRPRDRRLRDVRHGAGRAPRRVQGARRDGNRPRRDERRHLAPHRPRSVRAVRKRARRRELACATRGGSRRTC